MKKELISKLNSCVTFLFSASLFLSLCLFNSTVYAQEFIEPLSTEGDPQSTEGSQGYSCAINESANVIAIKDIAAGNKTVLKIPFYPQDGKKLGCASYSDKNELIEYNCTGGATIEEAYTKTKVRECPYGCKEGKCLECGGDIDCKDTSKPYCNANGVCQGTKYYDDGCGAGDICNLDSRTCANPQCDDTKDNDSDELVDRFDPGCYKPFEGDIIDFNKDDIQDRYDPNRPENDTWTCTKEVLTAGYIKNNYRISAKDHCDGSNTVIFGCNYNSFKFNSSYTPIEGYGKTTTECQYGCYENDTVVRCRECARNSDCSEGKICSEEGLCRDCLNDSECGSGKICNENHKCVDLILYTCQDIGTNQIQVIKTGGSIAINPFSKKQCAGDTLKQFECLSGDFDNADNTYSVSTKNCPYGCDPSALDCFECKIDSDCSDGNFCNNGRCQSGCTKDSDCQEKQYCDLSSHTCVNDQFICQELEGDRYQIVYAHKTSKIALEPTGRKGCSVNGGKEYSFEVTCNQGPKATPPLTYSTQTTLCPYGCDVETYNCKEGCEQDSDCPANQKCVDHQCVDKTECEDVADNDGDGLVDANDPGCESCDNDCQETRPYSCTDSDGEDEYQRGTVYYKKGNGTITVEDYCIDENILVEEICAAKPRFDENKKPLLGYGATRVNCQYGCLDGACQPECHVDADCQNSPNGKKCVEGSCTNECEKDEDCPDDKICYQNACTNKTECNDGIDNDNDGYIDYPDDKGCTSRIDDSENNDSICDNGLDDDNDGLIDMEDPGCDSPEDNSEKNANGPECDDGKDNDGNGKIDFRVDENTDPGCDSPADEEEKSDSPIIPTLEGIMENADGRYTAFFGYENTNDHTVTVAACTMEDDEKNYLSVGGNPLTDYCEQTDTFEEGRVYGSFEVTFNPGDEVTWTLQNKPNDKREVTATANSERIFDIEVYGNCIDRKQDGTYVGHFSYINKNNFDIEIEADEKNNYVTNSLESETSQPTMFIHGGPMENVFSVKFKDSVTWHLQKKTATLTKDSTSCEPITCTEVSIIAHKKKLNGDVFVKMNKEQTELLLKEKNPYPDIRDIQASARRRMNRTNRVNERRIKPAVLQLGDVMKNCDDILQCPIVSNLATIKYLTAQFKNLRRKVGRTVRQRNINEKTRKKLLNKNKKNLAEKLEILAKIPVTTQQCK